MLGDLKTFSFLSKWLFKGFWKQKKIALLLKSFSAVYCYLMAHFGEREIFLLLSPGDIKDKLPLKESKKV